MNLKEPIDKYNELKKLLIGFGLGFAIVEGIIFMISMFNITVKGVSDLKANSEVTCFFHVC